MTIEAPAPSIPELGPEVRYSIGDTVTLEHGVNPDALWLLIEPIHLDNDGVSLVTAGIEVDGEGKAIGFPGTISADDIKSSVGPRKVQEEVVDALLNVYKHKGITLPPEDEVSVIKSVTKYYEDEQS